MKKDALYRPLTIIMPIAAVLCATGVSAYQWRRLKVVEGESATAQAKLAQIDRELRSFEAQPPSEKYPTVPKTPREQAEFLDSLRANADVSRVQLIRWSNSTPQAAPQPAPSGDKAAANPSAGVSSIVSVIEVGGNAGNTRQFLYNITRSRRLYNLSDIKWARDQWPNTHLTITLTRFVAPPVPLPPGNTPGAHVGQAIRLSLPPGVHTPQLPGAPGSVPPEGVLETAAGAIALPNPMDAPGLAHKPYQTRLETSVSQLNETEHSNSSASSRPNAGPSAKR